MGTSPGLHPVIHHLDHREPWQDLAGGQHQFPGQVQADARLFTGLDDHELSPPMGSLHPHQGAHIRNKVSLLFMKEPALWHQGFIKAADGDGIEYQLNLMGNTPIEFGGLVHQLVIEGGIVHAKRLGREGAGDELSSLIFGGEYHAIG